MRELLEQGVGITIIGGVAAVGVLTRLLLLGYYGRLGRACTRFGETKQKTVAYIREDLLRRGEREQEIKNIAVYTEYRLAEGRIFGIRVGSVEHGGLYSLLLVGTSSVLAALAGVLTDCGYRTVLNPLFAGGASVTVLLMLDLITGVREKKKRIRLRLRDYIENCIPEENAAWETGEEKEKQHRKKEEKQERKKNCNGDKPKAAEKKKHGKAQEEKRRLTEELLRERRQLEARSFAEQRRKEREVAEALEVEDMTAQVQAEAAVTEQVQTETKETDVAELPGFSEGIKKSGTEQTYVDLINEFLKEYPA